MPNPNLETKITRCINATAVGTTAINGSVLDMQGYDGVLFVCANGTITDGVCDLRAQDGAASNLSDAADLAGTKTSTVITDDNKMTVLEIFKPLKRYIRPVVTRGGATGSVVDGVIAIQYSARKQPTTHDATTVAASKTVVSPAAGTA